MTVEEWKRKNPPIRKRPQTNADRIRAMTDEELADYIDLHTADAMWCKPPPNDCPLHETCYLCILKWLKSPVEVDNGGN